MLKSSQGEHRWLRFFALMGTAMAIREGTPAVPDTPTDRKELVKELRKLSNELQVSSQLETFGKALEETGSIKGAKGATYFLLELNANDKSLQILPFKEQELEEATRQYIRAEKEVTRTAGMDVVLVSVSSLAALRRAYPSYFLDSRRFLVAVEEAISP